MSRYPVPILTLSFCAVGAVLVAWDVVRSAESAVQKHRREVEAYAGRADDPVRGRASLFDRATPGNAWDTYRTAIGKFDILRIAEIPDGKAQLAILGPIAQRLRLALHQAWSPPSDAETLSDAASKTAEVLANLAWRLASDGHDRDAMDVLIAGFGLAQDFIRVSDPDGAAGYFQTLGNGALAGLRALDGHALRSEDLAPLCGTLDRLDRGLLGLGETFERDRVAWKRKAFEEVLREEGLEKYYTWRDGSSRTLFTARILAEVDRHHVGNAERGRRPPWVRVRPRPHGDGEHAVVAQFYKAYFCCIPDLAFEKEVAALENRALLRVGLALAWHQAETGGPPASLRDLVPRYLPALPVSPLDGGAFGFEEGTLQSRDPKGKVLRWPVQRR